MGIINWFNRKKKSDDNSGKSNNSENDSTQPNDSNAEKKYENWYNKEESNKRVERLKNALHGKNQH